MTRFSREWAMPSAETFSIPPIAELLRWYLRDAKVVVDPFARNNRFGTLTNDLNPETSAQFHEDAIAWLRSLRVSADAVLFDPPFSPRQISEAYQNVGRTVGMEDTQNARLYKHARDGLSKLLKPGGLAISCGWNSNGFGGGCRGYVFEEILIVCHGAAHNDTIVTVERKMQADLFGGPR